MSNASGRTERLEILGSAAAGIAHDINNQLTLIVNHLSLQNPADPLQAAAVAAVARCSALTSGMLAFARGETVQLTPVDLTAFMGAFLARLQLPNGVRLVSEVPASLPPMAADPLSLERMLLNLISNACAAMNNSGTLRVSASARKIEVADSGPGIPPDDTCRVFEPFFTTKGTQGTGLGLSIVREIMQQHGGSVTVRSEPGRGAQFTLLFRAPGAPTHGVTGLRASPRKIAPAA
jgi:two-component system, cell cycle sensor histidine kinase and response regulator CckA